MGHWPRMKAQAIQQSWIRIATTSVYSTYIELLMSVSRKLDVEIGDLEMLLFAKAEDLAQTFNTTSPSA